MNFQYNIKETESGMRIDQLMTSFDEILSRAQAQRLLKSGNVLIDGKPELVPSRKVRVGQEVKFIIPKQESANIIPEEGTLEILYEDSHLIVVNKAAGLVVHPSVGHYSGTLVNYLMHHCQDLSGVGGLLRPGFVHWLYKNTSGFLVVAKTDEAHLNLSKQFQQHTVKRQYQALVWGTPKKKYGIVNAPLRRHPVRRKDMSIVESDTQMESEGKKGKNAITHWRVLQCFEFATLLTCRLETGRTHQIRVHLTSIGHPVIGDQQYGKSPLKRLSGISVELSQAITNLCRQALHAELLGFIHPSSGEWLEFKALFPNDFQNLLTEMQRVDAKL